MNASTLVEIISMSGTLTVLSGVVSWWLNRGKTRVDSAQVVQGMALDMLKPLHEELAAAQADIASLRKQSNDVRDAFSALLVWAQQVKMLMDHHNVEYPPIPDNVRRIHSV